VLAIHFGERTLLTAEKLEHTGTPLCWELVMIVIEDEGDEAGFANSCVVVSDQSKSFKNNTRQDKSSFTFLLSYLFFSLFLLRFLSIFFFGSETGLKGSYKSTSTKGEKKVQTLVDCV